MTRQESFERRNRKRMARTGKRYAAARRVLLDRSSISEARGWVSEPEMSDEAVGEGKVWVE